MLAVYGDAEAMRWVGDGTPLSPEECDRWLVVTAENYAKRGYGMFALVERETGAVVGFCGLVHFGGQAEPEIKYALLRCGLGPGPGDRGGARPARLRRCGPRPAAGHRHGRRPTTTPRSGCSPRPAWSAAPCGTTRTDPTPSSFTGARRETRRPSVPELPVVGAGGTLDILRTSSPAMSTESVSYADFDVPPPELMQAVDDGLERYNQQAAPLADVRPLGSFASDPGGRVIGGAVGRTWGGCCELQQLWVDADHRRRGVASRLLRQFEARASEPRLQCLLPHDAQLPGAGLLSKARLRGARRDSRLSERHRQVPHGQGVAASAGRVTRTEDPGRYRLPR